MPTPPFLSARAPSQNGATKNGAVRTISMLPPHFTIQLSQILFFIPDCRTARLQDKLPITDYRLLIT
jgi:hypothetical protein